MNNNLLQSVAENAAYVAEFAAIIVAMFLIAYFFEKLAKRKTGDTERVLTTRKIAVIGSAVPSTAPPSVKKRL